jgi:cytochrome b
MSTNRRVLAVRIWDLPTRVFHISLLTLIAGMYVTGEVGGDWLSLHFLLGYAVLTLILFRLVWGFVGGYWSRFSHFVPTPSRLIRYVTALRENNTEHAVGHNPLGALSVLAMLLALLLQVLSGFCSDDEIAASGPWTSLISGEWVSLATNYHTEIGQVLLILLIGLHVASIAFYRFIKHDDLITPMINGDKSLPIETPPSKDTASTRVLALAVLAVCGYVVYRLVNLT